MGKFRPNGELIVANTPIIIDAPIVNWRQSGWDATSVRCIPTDEERNPKCIVRADGDVPYGNLPLGPYVSRLSTRPALRSYSGRPPPIDAVKALIKKFVIHHDGMMTSDGCFNVLQNERGLSCHFLIDNDGTIFQTCDLMWMAYHGSEWNTDSIGVELCNRGDAKKEPDYYSRHKMQRSVKPCRINKNTILAFDFTPEQYESMGKLGKALQRILPNIPAEYPQSSAGVQSWDTMPYASTFSFTGYIGHYHLTAQKWDPGPFDFKEFTRKLRGAFCYPIWPKDPSLAVNQVPNKNGVKAAAPLPTDQPIIPTEASDLKDGTDSLFKANEVMADGGFFPVGPWGEARLWHGGVHLTATVKNGGDQQIFAPFPGRLVAARMTESTSIGSVNFLLLRHDMTLGTSKVQFYSLYMHLADETKSATPAGWVGSKGWKEAQKAGFDNKVALLDEPIEAGAIIGHIGKAGPAELSRTQMHLEFFSTAELFTDVKAAPWHTIDGTSGGRFCESSEVTELIDTDHDGALSRSELQAFYSGGAGAGLRYFVTYHVSEWTADPPWGDALRVPKDFKKMKSGDLDQMIAEQITPGLWWDAKVAQHCKLPPDGVVYHYHPVSFVGWFNQQLLDAAAANSSTAAVSASDASTVPSGITDDREGGAMLSTSEIVEDPCNKSMTLEQMVMGYDAPECGAQP